MAQLVFLNERSHPEGDLHPDIARQSLTDLVSVLVQIKRAMPELSLISAEPLPALQIGNNYTVARWLNEAGVHRERARFLLTQNLRAPFRIARDLFGDRDPGVTVYRYEGDIVEGVGFAHLYGGMPMSFNLAPWTMEKLELVVEQLTEDGEHRWNVETPHASTVEHVQRHHAWLVELRRRDVKNAQDLYTRRRELFPFLEFAPDIEWQLAGLQVAAFLQVYGYLCRLDDAVEMWDPRTRPAPDYPPNTTDEHEQRKRLCFFNDPRGGKQQFSWHGRFTPGPGRIHFRIEAEPKKAILGYIGRKVGI